MDIRNLNPGPLPPKKMTAVIEVPEGGRVKYEIDKSTGLLKVDRILHTPLSYPADYGYFPGTLGDDGDPLDCVVVSNSALYPGVLIDVRPIGVLLMKDQVGGDEKIIKQVVFDTLWHEIAHHFGFEEEEIQKMKRKKSQN